MAKRSAALARSLRPVPNPKSQLRNVRRSPPASGASLERPGGPGWSELEQAFFDAAPPDELEAGAEPERFDDLDGPSSTQESNGARRAWGVASAALRRLMGRA